MAIKIPQLSSLRRKQALAITIGLGAVVWFLALSGWLSVAPGSIMMKRQNVLFHSDTNLWIQHMASQTPPRRPGFQSFAHPLEGLLWRPVFRALYYLLLRMRWSPEYAAVYAGRLLVAIVAGIGVGSLVFLAASREIKIAQCILLFIAYLLFTANTIVALPEHFGLSNGLLSVAFAIPTAIAPIQLRTIMLAGLTILTGGTTITNGLFPVAYLAHSSLRRTRLKVVLSVAAVLGLVGITIILMRVSYSLNWFVRTFLNTRLLHDPYEAGIYTLLAVVYPAIGPNPFVKLIPSWNMVSYDPFKITQYSWIQAIGVAAWVVLLFRCVSKGLREVQTRPYVWLLLSWILFNAMFHNIWGDEVFLFAPHWSWALIGLIVLGGRDLSLRFTAATVIPLATGQIYTLLRIRAALQSIGP